MPFSGSYASASPSAPDTDLTDFVSVIDLADLPQSWWDEVDTSDGTKGRASKDDGTTELATEWVDFDDVAETGFLWVKWSGTLSSSGGDAIRVYPPKSTNSSYAVTGTFGRNAVWSDYTAVYHGNSINDASGNGNTLVEVGTVTEEAGKIGKSFGTQADTDYYETNILGDINKKYMSAWINYSTAGVSTLDTFGAFNSNERFYIGFLSSSDAPIVGWGSGSVTGSTTITAETWYKQTMQVDGSSLEGYIDGVSFGSSVETFGSSPVDIWVGSRNGGTSGITGRISEIRISTNYFGADHESQEYSNQNNITTFWGAWTFEGTSISVDASLLNDAQSVDSTAGVDVSIDTTLVNEPQSISGQSSTSFSIDGSLSNASQSVSSIGAVDVSTEASLTNSLQSVQSTIKTIVANVNVSLTNAPQSVVYEAVVDGDLQASDITDSGFTVSFSPAETKGASVSVTIKSNVESINEPQSISSQGSIDVTLDASIENNPQTIASTVTFTELNVSISLTNAPQDVESLIGDFEKTILELKSIIRDIEDNSLMSDISGDSKINDISGNSDIDDILVSSNIESINLKSEF